MQIETLSSMVAEVYVFFRFKEMPDARVIKKWHEKVEFIPDIASEFISRNLTDLDSVPRNLPKAIIRLWYEYQKQPGHGVSVHEACEDCNGRGFISYRKWEPEYGYKAQYTARCGSCNNRYFGSSVKISKLTAAQILNRGWDLLKNDSPIITQSSSRTQREIDKQVGKVGKPVKKEMGQIEKVQEAQRQRNEMQKEFPF